MDADKKRLFCSKVSALLSVIVDSDTTLTRRLYNNRKRFALFHVKKKTKYAAQDMLTKPNCTKDVDQQSHWPDGKLYQVFTLKCFLDSPFDDHIPLRLLQRPSDTSNTCDIYTANIPCDCTLHFFQLLCCIWGSFFYC